MQNVAGELAASSEEARQLDTTGLPRPPRESALNTDDIDVRSAGGGQPRGFIPW